MMRDPSYEISVTAHTAEVTADFYFQVRIPKCVVMYLSGRRDYAKEDAIRYAEKEIREVIAKNIPKFHQFVRAEITFSDDEGVNKERFNGERWMPWLERPTEEEKT